MVRQENCADCGASILHRRPAAKRCEACAYRRVQCTRRDWKRKRAKDPAHGEYAELLRGRKLEKWSERGEGERTARNSLYRHRYHNDPEFRARCYASKHRYRAGAKGIYSPKELADKFAKFDERCAYCRSTGPLEIEHVIPVSSGGSNEIENIVPACGSCNRSKCNRDVHEWLEEMRERGFRWGDKEATPDYRWLYDSFPASDKV